MGAFRTQALVILFLLCGIIVPIIQVGVVIGVQRGGGGGGDFGGGMPNPNRPAPTARPTFAQPTARPTFSGGGSLTGRPTFTSGPSLTTRPTFTGSAFTSFSFSTRPTYTGTAFTSFSFTRTVQTSYTFNPTFTFTTTNYGPTYTTWSPGYYPGYWYPGMTFPYYPPGYSTSTGSFTLEQTLYGPNNSPCLYYAYFSFNALAGMTIQARLWTSGPPVNYIVVPMSMVNLLQGGNGCSAVGYLAQTNTVGSTPYLYSWTAQQNGEYAVIFYSTSPYTAPVYFLPA